MENNLKQLNEWYNGIKVENTLSIIEVKKIIIEIDNTTNKAKKELLRNKLILGTTNQIYDFIKKSGLLYLKNNSYDIDDIINSCCEIWIEYLDNKEILKVDSFSKIFNNNFYSKLSETLNIEKYDICYITNFTVKEFNEIITWYFKEKNIKLDITYRDLKKYIEENYYRYRFDITIDIKELFMIINQIYDMCCENKFDINLSKTKLYRLQNLFVDCVFNCQYMNENLSDSILDDYVEFEVIKVLIKNIFNSERLTDTEKQVIFKRYGFAGTSTTLNDIAKDLKKSRERIRQIESKSLRKIRRLNEVMEYYRSNKEEF